MSLFSIRHESSKGFFGDNLTQRIHFNYLDNKLNNYDIAIETLSLEEQSKIVANNGKLGFFKRWFWTPLKVNDQIILVNINSVIKRLECFKSKKEVIRSIKNQTFLRKINEFHYQKILKEQFHITDSLASKLASSIQDKTIPSLEDCKNLLRSTQSKPYLRNYAQLMELQNYSKRLRVSHYQVIAECEKIKLDSSFHDHQISLLFYYCNKYQFNSLSDALNNLLEQQKKNGFTDPFEILNYSKDLNISLLDANEAVNQLIQSGLKNNEIRSLSKYVKKNQVSWQNNESLTPKKPLLVRYRKLSSSLPRNLQINRAKDGSIHIFVLFNRCTKEGDRLVGVGGVKRVKTAVNLLTGQKVARSSMNCSIESDLKLILKELEINQMVEGRNNLLSIDSTSILKYRSLHSNSKVSFMQELCDCDLLSFLEKGKFNEKELFILSLQLLEAVHLMHTQFELFHRDLKPENILIQLDNNGNFKQIKIGDFGCACLMSDTKSQSEVEGTSVYMSPEYCDQIRKDPKDETRASSIAKSLSTKHDAWAVGLILLRLYQNSPAWEEALEIPWFKPTCTGFAVIDSIANLGNSDKEWLPKHPLNSIEHVIWLLLRPDPSERIDCGTALALLREIHGVSPA